jgi:dienelactone hydrolase
MEIWGVNDTMRRHAHEFAQAGFVCLVPDLFWRQESERRRREICQGRRHRANGGLPNVLESLLARFCGLAGYPGQPGSPAGAS